MSWSLNEIESLAKKAARGAGYSWGLAEEAGKATRWLCAAGLPGDKILAQWLQENDGCHYEGHCPDCAGLTWRAKSNVLCPLSTGAALCDRANVLSSQSNITLQNVAHPLLLIPYLASASDISGRSVTINWPGASMCRAKRQTWIEATPEALAASSAGEVKVCFDQGAEGNRVQRCYRGTLSEESKSILMDFAHRTYAPDTPESRLAGAGAGLTDND